MNITAWRKLIVGFIGFMVGGLLIAGAAQATSFDITFYGVQFPATPIQPNISDYTNIFTGMIRSPESLVTPSPPPVASLRSPPRASDSIRRVPRKGSIHLHRSLGTAQGLLTHTSPASVHRPRWP